VFKAEVLEESPQMGHGRAEGGMEVGCSFWCMRMSEKR